MMKQSISKRWECWTGKSSD